nr:uncharacterized protein K02A2.6-like [Onthophagus taurus]
MAELTNVLAQIADILKNVQATQNQIIENKQTNYTGRDNLQPYDENNENFDSYLQRLDNHLQLRGVDKNSQTKLCVQILIGCLSPKIYQILTKLTAPDLPNTRSYDELIKLLREYLAPQASVTAEQHKFYTRLQGEGESIQCYVAELRKLTTNCEFNCTKCKTSTIETHLRAQFIRGVRNAEVRARLLQQKNPTFDDVVQIAKLMEVSKKESSLMQAPGQINAIQKKSNHFNGNRKNYTKNTENMVGKCFRCGKTGHKANNCQAKNLKCYKCKKEGHVQSVCMQRSTNTKAKTQKQIDTTSENEQEEEEEVHPVNEIVAINSLHTSKILLPIRINEGKCNMELDTGAAVSTISIQQFKKICPNTTIHPTNVKLRTYTGEIIHPTGSTMVKIRYNDQTAEGKLYVLPLQVDAIFGRDWLQKIKINWPEINNLHMDIELETFLNSYRNVLSNELGEIPNYKYSHKFIDPNTRPVFCKPRPVPYALQPKVEEELDRLEGQGIIEKTIHSSWGTPIVPVSRKDGRIRICAAYNITINKYLQDDRYPIPRIEDIFNKMKGGKYFCTLDVGNAYLHMKMDEECSMIQAISTHKGVYKVKRLMFGVKTAPSAWQRFMDKLMQDLDGVVCLFGCIYNKGHRLQ